MSLKSPFETIRVDKLNNRNTMHTITSAVKKYIESDDGLAIFFNCDSPTNQISIIHFEDEEKEISTIISIVKIDGGFVFQEKIDHKLYYYFVKASDYNVSFYDAVDRFILSNSKMIISREERDVIHKKMNDLISKIPDKYDDIKSQEERIPRYIKKKELCWKKYDKLDSLMNCSDPDYDAIFKAYRNTLNKDLKEDEDDLVFHLIINMDNIENGKDKRGWLFSVRDSLLSDARFEWSFVKRQNDLLSAKELELGDLITEYEKLKYFIDSYCFSDDVTENNFYNSLARIKEANRNTFTFHGEEISLSKLDKYF